MKDAVFLIVSPSLLNQAITQIDEMFEGLERQAALEAQQGTPTTYQDLMGDLYEYMLSKAGQTHTQEWNSDRRKSLSHPRPRMLN